MYKKRRKKKSQMTFKDSCDAYTKGKRDCEVKTGEESNLNVGVNRSFMLFTNIPECLGDKKD